MVLLKSEMENPKIHVIWVSLLPSIVHQTSEEPVTTGPYPASTLNAGININQQQLKIRTLHCGY